MSQTRTFTVKASGNSDTRYELSYRCPDLAADDCAEQAVKLGLVDSRETWNDLARQQLVVKIQNGGLRAAVDKGGHEAGQRFVDNFCHGSRRTRTTVVEKVPEVSIEGLDQTTIETYAVLARQGKIVLVDGDGNEVDPGEGDDS